VIAIWVLTVSRLASVLGVLECWWVTSASAVHTLPARPHATGHTTLPGRIVFAEGNGRDIRIYRARGDGSRRHLLIADHRRQRHLAHAPSQRT
jgi:hypothetical protein